MVSENTAKSEESIRSLAEALLIYAQHYPSCDGQLGVDGCCECGLSDWLAVAGKLSPDGRGGDYLSWRKDVVERGGER